jgi:hypothetical protein
MTDSPPTSSNVALKAYEDIRAAIRDAWLKVLSEATNPKFYALLVSLITIGQAHANGKVDDWQALLAVVTALGAYAVGTGIQAAGHAVAASKDLTLKTKLEERKQS